ncbi:MAG: excisionase family DNA-binding protein [Chloroflexi bacterium]|nr:excisionase family DNA-binding protein [Chloroflexota bacterium]
MIKRFPHGRYCTVSEAATRLKVTRQTIYRWIADGRIKTEKIGREMIIEKTEISNIIRNVWMASVRDEIHRIVNDFFIEKVRLTSWEVEPDTTANNFGFTIKFEEPFIFMITWPDGKRQRLPFRMDAIHVNKDGHIDLDVPKDFTDRKEFKEKWR